jgi:hypothetical protein
MKEPNEENARHDAKGTVATAHDKAHEKLDDARSTTDAAFDKAEATLDKAHSKANDTIDAGAEKVDAARDKVAGAAEKVSAQADAGREKAASGLEKAADVIDEKVGGMEGASHDAGTMVADRMDTAAAYIREHNSDEMLHDFESFVRRQPVKAVAGAVFAGYVFGRIFK